MEDALAKKVRTLSGTVFPSVSKAEEHFDAIRQRTEIKAQIPDPDRADIIDIYVRYCAATDYSHPPVIGVTTAWNNDVRPGQQYAPTKAFAVVTASGEHKTFSMPKALKAIAE